jgi:hypothetical protein
VWGPKECFYWVALCSIAWRGADECGSFREEKINTFLGTHPMNKLIKVLEGL